jgi:DNA-binding CsgD family transcriptional regulator
VPAADRSNPRSRLARRTAGRDARGLLRGSLPALLTPEQERAVRKAWAAGKTQGEIAADLGIGRDRLVARLRDQLADLPRPGRGHRGGRRQPPPTPEEIHERAAVLRHGWSPERWLDPLGSAADAPD